MKYRIFKAGLAGISLTLASLVTLNVCAQEAPQSSSSDSVAKPRKPANEPPPPEEEPIPSEYKKPKDVPKDTPTFRSNATTVSVEVAVLDDHNRFIPNIPPGNFRVLEDGVPQQITQFAHSEAPMTICMLIEFSGRFQAFELWMVRDAASFVRFSGNAQTRRQCCCRGI